MSRTRRLRGLDSLANRVLIGVAVLAVALAASIGFVVTSVTALRDAAARERRSERIITSAQRAERLVIDLETGQRGFVITGSERFLDPWKRARRELPRQIASLGALVRGDPSQVRRVRAIAQRAAMYGRDYNPRVIDARRRSEDAARRIVASGRGKAIVDDLRRRFAELTAAESRRASRSTRDAVVAVETAERRSIATLIGSFLLILAFGAYLRRGVLRPVHSLATATDRLAAGDAAARVMPGGTRELADLAASFNAMALSLEHGRAELERSNKELQQAHAETEAAAAEARRLAAIVEGSEDAILSKDLEGVILSWNRGAERLYGYTAEEAVGQPISILIPAHRQGEEKDILARVLADRPLAHYETERVAKDGRIIPVMLTVSPVRDGAGQIVGASTIAHDITEQKAAEQAVARAREEAEAARDEAERANLAKSEFLSRMSHELRTPLNAILGFGQLLEMAELDEEHRDSVEHILRGGRHLLELINEVLDISRIEAGTISMSLEPVAIGDVVADASSLVRPIAEEREVRLVSPGPELYERFVMADKQRLKQVLLNLLSNAIKYNRERGTVTIELADVPAGLRISVSDEGAGIPADRLERLFVPFDRLGAESSEVEGTGLGLALSKRLVEAMGGTLRVRSGDAGSTFDIELRSADRPARVARRRATSQAGGLPSLDRIAGATVLYIEDNLSNVKLIERILENQPQVKLVTAMQGTLGIDLARRHQPDLVLLDLHLPDVSGSEVLAVLQRDPATVDIPVIILSADATARQIEALRAAGASDYLTKPIDVERFHGLLDRYLNGKGPASE